MNIIEGIKKRYNHVQSCDGYLEQKEKRKKAFLEFLNEGGVPSNKVENYKYTPFDKQLSLNIDFNKSNNSISFTKESIQNYFLNENGNHLVFINGDYDPSFSTINNDEITLIDKSNFVDEHSKYFTGFKDPFKKLNESFLTNDTEIKVKISNHPSNLFIYHFFDGLADQVISQPKINIVVGDKTKLNIVDKTINLTTSNTFHNSNTELFLHEWAHVNYIKLQEYNNNSFVVDNLNVVQEKGSVFNSTTISFSGKIIRNNLDIVQSGESCESTMNGLYLLKNKDHVDNHTTIDHMWPNTESHQLYKGIVDDKARAVFNGKILVRPKALKTKAFQSNKNIILSDKAVINTKPQLEIFADDVKCSHGCTIGQLDEEIIFYLRARGLDEQQAKILLLNTFIKETLSKVPIDSIKDEVDKNVTKNLSK